MGDGPTSEVSALVLALVRSDLLKGLYDETLRQYPTWEELAVPDAMRVWAVVSLWLASLSVVVEGWEKLPEEYRRRGVVVEGVLSRGNSHHLRQLRNKVFHSEPYNHPHSLRELRDLATVLPWAEELSHAFKRDVKSIVADG